MSHFDFVQSSYSGFITLTMFYLPSDPHTPQETTRIICIASQIKQVCLILVLQLVMLLWRI
jgi:hypothetical protein